jgi:hypothetical protein
LIIDDACEEFNHLKNIIKSTNNSLTLKSKMWKYEEEIRIYKKFYGLNTIKKDAIAKIYFGVKAKQSDINDIVKICSKSGYTKMKAVLWVDIWYSLLDF